MRFGTLRQEEFFEEYEFGCPLDLAESGVEAMTYGELTRLTGWSPPAAYELGYTPASGWDELRSEIATAYQKASLDNVLVTTGAIEALFVAFNLLLAPGDRVVCLWPSYQPLFEIPRAIGAEIDFIELRHASGFRIDVDAIEARVKDRTRMVVLNLPHNPTGQTVPPAQIRELAERLAGRGVYVLLDEVFRLAGVAQLPSAWDGNDHLLVVGGMSKAFGLAGVRIGWLLADPALVIGGRRCRKYTSWNSGALDQAIALVALRCRERLLERTRRLVRDGRRAAEDWFGAHREDFALVMPPTGSLLFPKMLFSEPSRSFCERVFAATGTLIAPGEDCYGMEGFLRLGVGTRRAEEGLRSLEACLPGRT